MPTKRMPTRRSCCLLFGTLFGVLGGAMAPANASAVAAFYKGKTVSIIVPYSTGGGYDTMARAIGRFIGKHIPGDPTIVVRNMPGAGGISAMNYLYNVAAKDGTIVGAVGNTTPMEPLFGTKQAHFDSTKFNWLGTPSYEVAMVLVWHTVPVHTLGDLRRRVTSMGATGSHSTPAFYARLLNATLGTKMKLIPGYPGQNDALIAMERGELDGFPSVFYSSLSSTRPHWLPDKLARAIVQYGPHPLKELGNVPFAPDVITNPEDKQLMKAAIAPLALGRPWVAPPGVPTDRVAALRKALAETFADPAFLAQAKKEGLIINEPRTGAQLQDIIVHAYRSPSRVVKRLRKLYNPNRF